MKNKSKIKTVIFVFSLALNGLFILLFVFASLSNNSTVMFSLPPQDFTTAAMITSFPRAAAATINRIDIDMARGDKFILQYSFINNRRQSNLLIHALFDPNIISVVQTGFGIEITAVRQGQTLMQMVTNDGIRDLALVTVE